MIYPKDVNYFLTSERFAFPDDARVLTVRPGQYQQWASLRQKNPTENLNLEMIKADSN